MRTPVVIVTAALTVATLLAASFLIATGTRGEDTSFASSAGQLEVQTIASGLVHPRDPQARSEQRWPVLTGAACRVKDIPAWPDQCGQPGDKRRAKQALARKRNRKKLRRELE